MEDEQVVYTIPEVARILRVSESLAYQMARKGELPTFRVRNRVLVRRQALEEFMARRERLQTDLQTNQVNPFAKRSHQVQDS